MVRKKVRTGFLLFKKNSMRNVKGKNCILTFQEKNSKGKEKGKNSNLTFPKNHMVRKKVRTGFLLFKTNSKGKKKGKN